MSVRLDVSHPDRSTDSSDEQPQNRLLVLLGMSHPERSTDLSDEQSLNMPHMYTASEVSRPDKSAVLRFSHFANIPPVEMR